MSDLERERNIQLIEEREDYEIHSKEQLEREFEEFENSFLTHVVENMVVSEEFDKLMHDRIEYIDDNFDFETSPAYEELEEIYYENYALFQKETLTDYYYPIAPDGSMIEGFDYPEGREDNYEDMYFNISQEPDFPEEAYYENLVVNSDYDYIDYLVESIENENKSEIENTQKLIREHLKEEKDYLNSIVESAIDDGYYFHKAVDEAILESVDVKYDIDDFNYENSPKYWNNTKEEKSDINLEKEDLEKIKVKIIEYFTKDDTLDTIIKDVIKDKKFK